MRLLECERTAEAFSSHLKVGREEKNRGDKIQKQQRWLKMCVRVGCGGWAKGRCDVCLATGKCSITFRRLFWTCSVGGILIDWCKICFILFFSIIFSVLFAFAAINEYVNYIAIIPTTGYRYHVGWPSYKVNFPVMRVFQINNRQTKNTNFVFWNT